jgi:hypothetical protein
MPTKLTDVEWEALYQIDRGSLSGTGVNRKTLDRLAELGLTNWNRGFVVTSPAGKRIVAARLAANQRWTAG